MKDKFLVVYAVFDDDTQTILSSLQKEILSKGIVGTQTMDIPFHITLGSFSVDEKTKLCEKMCYASASIPTFDIALKEISNFGNKVVFAQPTFCDTLSSLHDLFVGFDNDLKWHPHATLFQTNDNHDFEVALNVAKKNFKPLNGRIIALQLGEFFPTDIIFTLPLATCKKK